MYGADEVTSYTADVIVSNTGMAIELTRILKESIFGNVYHGLVLMRYHDNRLVRLQTPTQVAVKQSSKLLIEQKRSENMNVQENPVYEIAIMHYMRSNITDMVHFYRNIINYIEFCEDDENIYSVLEFCDNGDLFELVYESSLTENEARFYFKQVLNGLRYIHSLPASHRDLSLENVMLNDNVCKIIDFGMTIMLPRNPNGEVLYLCGLPACGKRNYMAPEVVFSSNRSTQPLFSDVWSLGIMLFILIAGFPPFECVNDRSFRFFLEQNVSGLLTCYGITDKSPEVIDLLQKILVVNPLERASLSDIQNHPWMQLQDE